MRSTAKVKGMLLSAALLSLFTQAQAQAPIGVVLAARGQVTARAADGSVRMLSRRQELYEGDAVVVGAAGFSQIKMGDDAMFGLGANTEFTFGRYQFDKDPATQDVATMTLLRGCFMTISGSVGGAPGDQHWIETPLATIRIRGTVHSGTFDGTGLYTAVYQGGTTVTNAQGSVELGIGANYDFSRTSAGTPPEGLIDRPAQLGTCTIPESTQSAPQPNGLIAPAQDQDYSTGPVVSPSAAPSSPADARPDP